MLRKIKMIQVNIWKAQFLDALIAFLRAEDPDIITMQEVPGGSQSSWHDTSLDVFLHMQKALRMRGVFTPEFGIKGDASAYQSNAVLTKGEIVAQKVAWLRRYENIPLEYESDDRRLRQLPRNILDVTIRLSKIKLHVLSIHGAWNRNPVDTKENCRQAKKIAAYCKRLHGEPFLVGADLNMPPQSRVIQTIDAVARNAVLESGITRTLHPTIHKTAKEKPKGIVVDYIYTSPHFTVDTIDAPVVPVSDHLPICATFSYHDSVL